VLPPVSQVCAARRINVSKKMGQTDVQTDDNDRNTQTDASPMQYADP